MIDNILKQASLLDKNDPYANKLFDELLFNLLENNDMNYCIYAVKTWHQLKLNINLNEITNWNSFVNKVKTYTEKTIDNTR